MRTFKVCLPKYEGYKGLSSKSSFAGERTIFCNLPLIAFIAVISNKNRTIHSHDCLDQTII